MSGSEKVKDVALDHGWALLHEGENRWTVYKWLPGIVRHEISVVTDAQGRIEAVSEWLNRRAQVVGGKGVRAEAEALLASEVAEP